MSLTFPGKCKYLDVEGTGVLSSTSPSVELVWLTPCHTEGSRVQRQKGRHRDRRKPSDQCNLGSRREQQTPLQSVERCTTGRRGPGAGKTGRAEGPGAPCTPALTMRCLHSQGCHDSPGTHSAHMLWPQQCLPTWSPEHFGRTHREGFPWPEEGGPSAVFRVLRQPK